MTNKVDPYFRHPEFIPVSFRPEMTRFAIKSLLEHHDPSFSGISLYGGKPMRHWPIHSQRVVAVQARFTRNCSHVWSHWPIGHRYQWEEWRNYVQHRLAQSNYLDS